MTDSRLAPHSVLIVEDNEDAADMLRLALGLAGLRAEIAPDGARAIELARATRPDVMLIDLGLPDVDGCEVARQVRAVLGSRVILVALTGYGQPGDRRRTQEAGFDHHLLKPVNPDDVVDLIAKATAGRDGTDSSIDRDQPRRLAS